MDLASVVAALASVGVRVSGSTPNSSVQVDSSRACPTGLAGPEPSGTFHDPGQHFQTPEAEDAFSRLKERLLGQLGLFLVDPDKGFVLRTDASDYAVGAVLEQIRDDGSHVPVAFWSRILAEGQRRTWTAREKETYAIVCALRKWSGHIGLQPVVVCTDHQSLQSWHKEHVDTPSGPAARRARWHETFAKFDLSVVYVPGKDNTVADCLSLGASPRARRGWTYPAMGTPRRPRRPSASSRWRRPWSKKGSSALW